MNRVLEKYQVRQPSVGTFTHLRSSVAVEALGTAGLDFVILDTEHCVLNPETMAECITAAGAAGLDALVRIHSVTREAVLHPLDLGAKGLIVPAVETVEEVERLVRFAKFPPVGGRGFCPTRDGLWGCDEASLAGAAVYMDRSNREALLIPQCETAGCLEHIDEICALEGIDGIFIGPFDLSIALGIPGDFANERHINAVAHVLDVCHRHGKLAVMFCGTAEAARGYFEQGFDSVTMSLDVSVLADAFKDVCKTALN